MKTPTLRSLLTAATLCISPTKGDPTGYSSGNRTSTSLVVPGYSSAIIPSFIPFTSFTSDLAWTTAGVILPTPTIGQTTAEIILTPTGPTITLPIVSSITNPATFSSFSTGTIPSSSPPSPNSTVLSSSLPYTQTLTLDVSSSTEAPSCTTVPVINPTTITVTVTIGTSTKSLSSTIEPTFSPSKTLSLASSHFFSWTGQTTFTTSTISLYTNPIQVTSGFSTDTGIIAGTSTALPPSANSTFSYAWPTLPNPSGTKTQHATFNTIPWQMFTPSAQIEARHIDGDS